MTFSPALALYRAAAAALGPFAGLWLDARVRAGKEDASRLGERHGRYAQARPEGALVWLHAASVGESGVALHLAEAMRARDASLSFLLSTGTRTSAELAARRAPPRTTHVYTPLDGRGPVRRFLRHWRPDLGVFVESELWPNLILEAEAAGVKLALVNARMSPGAVRRLQAWRTAGQRLLSAFAYVAAADARTAAALAQLRGEEERRLGNLKLAAAPPRIDAAARAALAAEIGARPVWLAASTHAGEDEIALAAHARLRVNFPDALLMIVPRHPERGAAIAALAQGAPRRSRDEKIAAAGIYVADTLGELGMFYDLAPVALVAGSLLPRLKGHNPVEPAKLGAAILTGPYVESFQSLFDALVASGGAAIVRDADELARAVEQIWRDGGLRAARTAAARALFAEGASAMTETVGRLLALLPAPEGAHAPA